MSRPIALFITLFFFACANRATTQQSPRMERFVVNEESGKSGYYVAIQPTSEKIEGVLFLLSGFGQHCESIIVESDLETFAADNDLLTVVYSGGDKIYLDEPAEQNLTAAISDVVDRFGVDPEKFVLGGFSAGGVIALRYVQKCKQSPANYPIKPAGVFMVDSPIDMFFAWDMFQYSIKNSHTEIAFQEADFITKLMIKEHGHPLENIETYRDLSPFSIKEEYGENEIYLKETAVRAYHDVDINWRLINRNQSVVWQNYVPTSELINRLLLLGNKQAEFIQTFQTGYRANGQRHPHSWSVVDEEECVKWIQGLLNK